MRRTTTAIALSLAALLAAAPAGAGTILIVTPDAAAEGAYEAFLESAAGGSHTVTVTEGYTGPLDAADKAELNAYDLVIMKSASSDYFYADDWNGLTVPVMLNHYGLAARNGGRWDWIERDAGATSTRTEAMRALDTGHPIFDGVTLIGGEVALHSPLVELKYFPSGVAGTQLAETGGTSDARAWLVLFEAGVKFNSSSEQTPAAERCYFPLVGGNGHDIMIDITPDGRKVLANTVDYLIGGEAAAAIPEPATLCALAAGAAGLAGYVRRRRTARA